LTHNVVPLQKIRTFYKIVENLHNKVIKVIKFGVKITFKGNDNSLKVQKNYFCNGTPFRGYLQKRPDWTEFTVIYNTP